MDLEANRILIPPERCQACILRRRQKATRRTLRLYFFIAYNILVISVICYCFWHFNDRLARNEQDIVGMQQQLNAPPDEHDSPGVSTHVDTKQTEELKVHKENTDLINIIESVRRRRAAKPRRNRQPNGKRKKKCKNCLPVVQIEGNGGYGQRDKTNLTNLWVTPKWVDPKNKQISKYYDVSSVQKAGRIKVKQDGLYMMYAQMALAGVTKRGYHVKKEPLKTTIASCANYSQVEGYENEQVNFMVRPCTLFTVLRLEKNDVVYIEEMEENSNVLYTKVTAVFGLIKVGV